MSPLRLVVALALLGLVLVGVVVLISGVGDGPRRDGSPPPAANAQQEQLATDVSGSASGGLAAAPTPEADAVQVLAALPPSGVFGPEVPEEGRTAVLEGTITVEGLPTVATLTVIAGPNAGATLTTDADGSYTWPALYPGLAVVRVEAGFAITREVPLRHRKTVRHDLDLGEHGAVEGLVLDDQGAAVIGATVSVDGAETRSVDRGFFSLPRHGPGEALLVVRADGFIPYCQRVGGDLGAPGGKPLDVTLQRGGSLELSLGPAPDGDVLVWLVPQSGQRLSGIPPRDAYPWHELNPMHMRPDETLVLHDLPFARLEAFAFHPTATGREFAWLTDAPLSPDELPRLRVELTPLPPAVVRVVRDGVPVPGATVTMTHANPLAATLAAFGDQGEKLLGRQPLALVPSARHAALTGLDGRATFGLASDERKVPFVTAVSPAGLLRITRRYEPRESPDGTREVVIDLADLAP